MPYHTPAASILTLLLTSPPQGKTLVGLWAIEAVASSGVCLVVLPSLMLIDQTLAEYKNFSQNVASGRSPVMVSRVIASFCSRSRDSTMKCYVAFNSPNPPTPPAPTLFVFVKFVTTKFCCMRTRNHR